MSPWHFITMGHVVLRGSGSTVNLTDKEINTFSSFCSASYLASMLLDWLPLCALVYRGSFTSHLSLISQVQKNKKIT